MGAGRRTSTYDVDTSQGPGVRSFEDRQRNLGSQLYGCIFGCNHDTFRECVDGLVFGLPRPHWCYVQYIQKGMPIYLFNYSNRELHGIFKAESDGTWEINPQGWCRPGQNYTSYPCQVHVSWFLKCKPIMEKDYRDIIKHCFQDDGHLRFELRKPEAQNLCRCFERHSPGYDPSAPSARPTPAIASTPRGAASGNNAAGSASAASTSTRQSVPGADYVEDDWQTTSKKKAAFKAAPQPATKAWGQSNKAADGALESRASAASDTNDSKALVTATSGNKGTASAAETAKKAQKEAWDAQARKKASALEEPAGKDADAGQQATSTPEVNGGSSQGFTGPDYNIEEQHQVQPTATPPMSAEDELTQLHSMMAQLDVGAADAMWQALYTLHFRLDEAHSERNKIAEVATSLQASNDQLKAEVAGMKHNMQLVMKQMRALSGKESDAGASSSHDVQTSFADLGATQNGSDVPSPKEQTVFLLGGNNGTDWLQTGDTFHPLTNTWHGGSVNLPYPNGYGAAAALGRSIYLMGGGQGDSWVNTALRYDADDQKWFECGQLREARGSLGAAALNGKLYAMGGGQPGNNLATAEVLDPEINVWMGVKIMSQARFSTTAAVVNGGVYVVGGFNGESYLKSVEMLDPRTGRWQLLPEMEMKRGSSAAATLGPEVVAVGGFDGSTFHSSVEAFDTRAGRWRSLAPMAEPRAYAAAANVDGLLYAMGGMCGAELGNNQTVERYDAASDAWVQQRYDTAGTAEANSLRLSFAAACVLDAV